MADPFSEWEQQMGDLAETFERLEQEASQAVEGGLAEPSYAVFWEVDGDDIDRFLAAWWCYCYAEDGCDVAVGQLDDVLGYIAELMAQMRYQKSWMDVDFGPYHNKNHGEGAL